MAQSPLDQQHPLWYRDRSVLDGLLKSDPSDRNLAECARLLIRYQGFPGARDIQSDLLKLLKQWRLSEEDLFQKTRQIHLSGTVYRSSKSDQQDDWS